MIVLRVAIISDIHANFEALYTLKDVFASVDKVVCLGDIIGYYCQVNEAIEYIRELGAICVLGNHDNFLVNGCPKNSNDAVRFGISYAQKVITSSNFAWLSSLPLLWGGLIGERAFLLVHGSPWNPLNDYLYSNNPALRGLYEFLGYDVIAFGQTHRGLRINVKKPLIINPGSVGQSRDIKAHACAVVLDTEKLAIENIQRPFNADKVIDIAKSKGAMDWVYKHLV